jgi:demethylmenaquinone methyltransferase/2-methoxy-6-polyprenyl-1,4-benzoquinol methylase
MNNTPKDPGSTTHFGYREVPEEAKAGLVAGVFRSVADRYDLMNDLMSLGAHRLWKDFAAARAALRPGEAVLDLAGGSGDMAARFAARVGRAGRVVLADINNSMLAIGRARLADRGLAGNLEFVQADAECLPFADASFDCVAIAFGLRNVTRPERALAAMCRVLRPGGRALVLEFSRPRSPALGRLYDAYSFGVLPRLGRLVAGDEASYRYLAESIRRHPDQETLKAMMEATGFERVRYHNLAGGIVALHEGCKF